MARRPPSAEKGKRRELPKSETAWGFLKRHRRHVALAAVIIVVAGAVAFVYVKIRAKRESEAWYALSQARTVEELETLATRSRGTKAHDFIKYALANRYYEAKRYREAEALYIEIAEAPKGSRGDDGGFLRKRALLDLACAYEEEKRFDEARETLKKLIARSSDPLWRELAMTRERLLEEAEEKAPEAS